MSAIPGDFFATHIGRQPVFVVRKPDGSLGCYLNACGHRGATLVTARIGNTLGFVCPYHGFCFDTAGKCTAVIGAEDRLDGSAPRPRRFRSHADRAARQLPRAGVRQPFGGRAEPS